MIQVRPFSEIPSVIPGVTVDLKLTGTTAAIDWLITSIFMFFLVIFHPWRWNR